MGLPEDYSWLNEQREPHTCQHWSWVFGFTLVSGRPHAPLPLPSLISQGSLEYLCIIYKRLCQPWPSFRRLGTALLHEKCAEGLAERGVTCHSPAEQPVLGINVCLLTVDNYRAKWLGVQTCFPKFSTTYIFKAHGTATHTFPPREQTENLTTGQRWLAERYTIISTGLGSY